MRVTSTPQEADRRDFWMLVEGSAATRLREAARAKRLAVKVFIVIMDKDYINIRNSD